MLLIIPDCPHSQLTEGVVSQRLGDAESRLMLLDFLLAELMAARMISAAKPEQGMTVEMVSAQLVSSFTSLAKFFIFSIVHHKSY